MEQILIHLILVIIFTSAVYGFSIPKVNVKLLKPKGIQFSLQEEYDDVLSDVKIFIFTSKGLINNLQYVESTLTKDDSGLWIYQTSNTAFTSDDSIEYWLYIQHNNLGYYTSQNVKVKDIEYALEQKPSVHPTPQIMKKIMYPDVNVKLLSPNGIRFSINEDSDIINNVKLIIFASKAIANNSKLIEVPLIRTDNGMWIYELPTMPLKVDDFIEYWLYGERNGVGFFTNHIIQLKDLQVYQPDEMSKSITMDSPKVTYPDVDVRMMGDDRLRFSLKESTDAYTSVKVLLFTSINNNSKFIEYDLKRDNSEKLWIYEMQNVPLKFNDIIEYWIYAENSNVGFFDSRIVRVQDIIDDNSSDLKRSLSHVTINNTYPIIDVKIVGTKIIQFSLQDSDAYNDVKILLFSPNITINNSQGFIENQMKRDDNGLWFHQIQTSIPLMYDDVIEYWGYIENSHVGFFSNGVFKVQDIAPLFNEATIKATTTTSTTTEIPINCEVSVSTVNGKSVGCKNSIIFNEDFNSDNLKYWNFDTRYPLDDMLSDAEFVVYEKRPETSFIRDDMLCLKAESFKRLLGFDDVRIRVGNYNIKERCTPLTNDVELECERQARFGYILPPVTSAYLTTRNKFSFMYGKVETRVRGPVGDWLYGQITLQPQQKQDEASNITTQHLKVFFSRGNENLIDDTDEIGGRTVYGGAILSKNPKNNLKWLKKKNFPNTHLGNDFHIYELLWTPSEISLSIDGIKYGSLSTNLRESAMAAKIKSAVNWANNGPFDKEHFISINLAVGSVKNFYSYNSTLLNGNALEPKPWNDTDPRAQLSFYLAHDKWYQTWKRPSLDVDYIKIYAV
ncbi:beta-1,3-glucan-binding protein-like isoform X2 [Chironomus tepperi]|uniref:beta-1,3-glucan-binding protein-like isoform X2 n=1 Tax=Chironomus tepperi TaxID=113505 RepID=UPI00391F3C73